METDVFFSSSGKRFLLWVVGFRCRSFVTVQVLNSIRTTAQITKQKKQTRECWADFDKVPGSIRTQIADVTSRYHHVFPRKKIGKLENEVP